MNGRFTVVLNSACQSVSIETKWKVLLCVLKLRVNAFSTALSTPDGPLRLVPQFN